MKKIKSIFLTTIFLTMTHYSQAQKNYAIETKSTFTVAGTSTLHDWEMKSNGATGVANLSISDSKVTDIHSLTINLLAESVKSEKTSMDKVAYETLNTKTYKNIKYVLKSADKINESTWSLLGTYTIAGVSKDYKTQVKTSVSNGLVTLSGTQKITFTDFGMKSPKALLGTIKTGNDLILNFNTILK